MIELVEYAKKARELAYAPYSKFKVGAALRLKNGEIITGCNIENAAYGECICAERVCLVKAASSGFMKDDIVEFAVIADTKEACSPCGACRQVLNELCNKDMIIHLANLKGDIKDVKVSDLLPYSFDNVEI